MSNNDKVPGVISCYPSPQTQQSSRQWGSLLSASAVALINTKLQLNEQDVLDEPKVVQQNFHFSHTEAVGALTAYKTKSANQIAQDYLEQIFLMAYTQPPPLLGTESVPPIPIDIVASVPAVRCITSSRVDRIRLTSN